MPTIYKQYKDLSEDEMLAYWCVGKADLNALTDKEKARIAEVKKQAAEYIPAQPRRVE